METGTDVIDRVFKNTIDVMENSKYQIFEILQVAREEYTSLTQELQRVIQEAQETIDKVDKLELSYNRARIRLTEVSRDFVRFTERDIRAAYEKATELQLELMIAREREVYLRSRRDELQMRVRSVQSSVERAESIGSQMSVVLEYLSGELGQVTKIVESVKNRQLMGLKIILAQEEERKRIAREIHDGPAQMLANLVLRTEIVERMLVKQEFGLVHREVVDLKGQVRGSLEEMRKVIFNLRPMALDDLGLIPTLRKYVHDFEEKTQIRTVFDIKGKEHRLSSAMEAGVFRLVQEALSNVAKHSGAHQVLVEITYQAQLIKIIVKDDGSGFNMEELKRKQSKREHFGLVGMRERVELLEGRMEIQSASGQGAAIVIHIPTNVDKGKE